MSLPNYPEYKASGVEWLGEVPGHWEVSSFRHCLSQMFNGLTANQVDEADNTVPVTRIETISYGVIDESKLGFISSDEAREDRVLIPGDILFSNINSLNMVGKCAFYPRGRTIYAGMNLLVLRPAAAKCLPLWLCWLVRSTSFRCVVESLAKPAINQASVSQSSINSITVAVPPLPEQIQIAAFLDRETGKIDALIAEQRRLVELLAEKRQAVISHAVTKGLNPNVPMKDSGIEWLGEVPEHWEIGSVKRFFTSYNPCRVPLSGEERSGRSGDFAYYGASGIIDYIDEYIFDEDLVLVSEDGANLVNRVTPIAFVATGKYWVNNHAHILKPLDENLIFWAERLEMIDLAPFITGSAQPKLTSEALNSLTISVPPTFAERLAIQNHIVTETAKLDTLTAEANRAIELLQERRSALISSAVTGKIDVREQQV